MNILKTTFLVTASALVLAGCGGVAPIISTPVTNIDVIPLKVTPISDTQLKMWNLADLATDTIPGMSVNRAYSELLKGKQGKQVIVAVIDSGIDIEHEDLKN
ncbi:MAG: cell wall-associated protease, partial [Candidatus Azotimanducaceae bacterium]